MLNHRITEVNLSGKEWPCQKGREFRASISGCETLLLVVKNGPDDRKEFTRRCNCDFYWLQQAPLLAGLNRPPCFGWHGVDRIPDAPPSPGYLLGKAAVPDADPFRGNGFFAAIGRASKQA